MAYRTARKVYIFDLEHALVKECNNGKDAAIFLGTDKAEYVYILIRRGSLFEKRYYLSHKNPFIPKKKKTNNNPLVHSGGSVVNAKFGTHINWPEIEKGLILLTKPDLLNF